MATDIKVAFPGARLISVRADGKEIQRLKGETRVSLEKLLPGASVYFVVWGSRDDAKGKNAEQISAVHAEGAVTLSRHMELPDVWHTVSQSLDMAMLGAAGVCLVVLLVMAYRLLRDSEAPTGSARADKRRTAQDASHLIPRPAFRWAWALP